MTQVIWSVSNLMIVSFRLENVQEVIVQCKNSIDQDQCIMIYSTYGL